MGMPRKPAVEFTPDQRVYFIDGRNTRWRVHDVAFGPPLAARFKRKRFQPGDTRATDRYFLSEDGEQRCFHFERAEARGVTVELLEQQLRSAGFPARERFDPSKHYSP